MIRLMSVLLGLLLLLAVGLAGMLLLVRDASPSLRPMPEISAEQRRWGKELLHEGLLEGVGAGGEPISMTLADLEILSVLLTEQIQGSRLRVRPNQDNAEVTLALRLPAKLGGWLNLRARLVAPDGVLGIEHLKVGPLPIPTALAALLMDQARLALGLPALPTGVVFSPEAIQLRPGVQSNHRGEFVSASRGKAESDRVLAAQRRLAGLNVLHRGQDWIDAAELLSALIASAPTEAADPVAENRAAILALAAYVNGRRLPDPTDAPAPRLLEVRLRGRDDLPQHFLTSGALLLQGGSGLANLIGLAKELDDASNSSGFSFSDLAANRAGNQFAELATASPSSARRIQRLARAGLTEDDIMPSVDWLPGSMSRATFERDFGGRDSAAYRIVVDEIDRRIEALPVNRE